MFTLTALYYFLLVAGPTAMIYMIMNIINGLRDCMKMPTYARVAKLSTYHRGTFQMFKLGTMTMLCEGDTMRSASAILGFTNGRVITPNESVLAMLYSTTTKVIWVWAVGVLVFLSSIYEQGWIVFVSIGFVLILFNISNKVNLIGRMLFFIGLLLLAIGMAIDSFSSLWQGIDNSVKLIEYIHFPDVVGIILCCFLGVFFGAIVSGNLISVFISILFIYCGIVGPECATAFVVGSELGVLFPMSMMVSETNLPARKSFLCYVIILLVVAVIDLLILIILPLDIFASFGSMGFILMYTLLFSLLLPIVYYLIGAKVWSNFKDATHDQLNSKRHLHQFDRIYRPHVSLMFIQAEKEIVNLQHRIHKMLGFIIDMLDDEDVEGSLEHVRKYKLIVYRTCKEITEFIMVQTSEKTNDYISDLAQERLQAVAYQSQLGTLFCDMAEAIYKLDKQDNAIIRRSVVSLETLLNQATKLIDSRYSVSKNEAKILDDDLDVLSLQLLSILKEYGKDSQLDVLPYTIEKSKAVIERIIKSLR